MMIDATEFHAYYKQYIDRTVNVAVDIALKEGLTYVSNFFKELPSDKHEYRYLDGKWTPKEILLHLIDTERVFVYRALQFSRADHVTLAGFDQDEFVANSGANLREMNELISEYITVRESSIQFFTSCAGDTLLRMGHANNSPLSVRAAGYIICGHERHHIDVIMEKYL